MQFTSKSLTKEALSSPNFYLAGGDESSVEDNGIGEFLRKRFQNAMQNTILSKTAKKVVSQYFQRIDRSSDELRAKEINLESLSFPGSLLDLIFKTEGNDIVSKSDEDNLFSLWKSSDLEGRLSVNSSDFDKANKLMNRGYVKACGSDDEFELTEKGRKVLVCRILGQDPKLEKKAMTMAVKEAALKVESYNIEGISKPLNILMVTHNPTTNIPENLIVSREIEGDLKQHGMIGSGKVQRAGGYLAVPVAMLPQDQQKAIEQEFGTSGDEYVNDIQNDVQNIPNSNSPHEKIPYGASAKDNQLSKFASSKIFSMIEKNDNVDCGIQELGSRGLKIKMIASDNHSREKGLMHSDPIKNNECALFVFDSPGNYGFWNRNVAFPIDVAFYDDQKNLVHVGHLDPHQESPISANSNRIKYVVETQKDWFDKNNVKSGSSIYEVLEKNSIV